jgi:hypothetical protein
MKLLVVIDYTGSDDPIRHPHGLSRLLAFASQLEELVAAAGVTPLTPVIWECEAPKGYVVFEADNHDRLAPLLARFGHHPRISVLHVRFLDELKVLGREVLSSMVNSGRSADPAVGLSSP